MKRFYPAPSIALAALALLGMTACTNPAPTTDTSTTTEPTMSDLPEGISLGDDGQTLVLAQASTLEAYCSDGNGTLAVSYVGEAGIDGQLLGCEQSYDPFNAAREDSFADVNLVSPVVTDDALQLQEAEYIAVMCEGDRVSLAPVLPERSDGHMTLECF